MYDVIAHTKAQARMCENTGYSVDYLPDGDMQPRTCMESKTLYLPRPRTDWTDHQARLARGYSIHENYHHHPTQTVLTDLMKREGIKYSSRAGLIINALDDGWINEIASREYRGFATDLDYVQAHHCSSAVERLEKGMEPDEFVLKLVGFLYKMCSVWQPALSRVEPAYNSYTDLSKWDHLIDKARSIVDQPTPEASVELLWEIAQEMLEAEGMNPEEEKGKPCDDGKEDEGKSDEPDSGDEECEDEGEGDGAGEGTESKDAVVSYEELMGHSHTEGKEGIASETKLEIKYDHKPATYRPYTWSEFDSSIPTGRVRSSFQRGAQTVYERTSKVAQKITRHFQSASQSGREYQLKRGKLTPKHLVRGAMGDTRVFNRKVERIDHTADVLFLCDCSGSMAGAAAHNMIAAIGQLSSALQVAGVPHKIEGFTERYGTCENRQIKGWDEASKWETIRDRFAMIDFHQNADGDHVLYAYHELMARDSKRKILIVLSDGMPCCDKSGDAYTYLREVTDMIQSKGRVELYGVGILSNAVSKFYNSYTVLKDSSDIERCLTEIVSKKIIKS